MANAERKTALTASGVVSSHDGYYVGYIVTTALGAGAITIYDNASAASGTVVDVIPASSAAATKVNFATPVKMTNGIYASFASTGTVLFLHN